MNFIIPDWPKPANVHALITTRNNGASSSPYDALNLGFHVADNPDNVQANWQQLVTQTPLPCKPQLLHQVHGNLVVKQTSGKAIEADGVFSRQENTPCAVLTADCLPVLLCDSTGTQVAALHAGWRGLVNGILDKGVANFSSTENLMVYLGPAICGQCFEVGREVVDAFVHQLGSDAENHFTTADKTHWIGDLYGLAKLQLASLGVKHIWGGQHCTFKQTEQFYSYRRDGITGRFASIIWLT